MQLEVDFGDFSRVDLSASLSCHMVEATGSFRQDPTSILDVYNLFWKLEMV
jgi:hypothetical protein